MENEITAIDIIAPVYNEKEYLENFLQSVRNFDVPEGVSVSILLIDGGSTDGTRDIISDLSRKYDNVSVINNVEKYTPHALNLGITGGDSDFVMRLDVHSSFPKDYLSKCLEVARNSDAHNVGGVIISKRQGTNLGAYLVQGIATHWFGVGDSDFRLGTKSGYSDTVPFGFFKREAFQKFGYFDTRLIRGQDYEYNQRIRHMGGTVWLDQDIKIFYFNQKYFFSFIKKQLLLEGPYNAYMWFVAPYSFRFRHAVTALFFSGIFIGPMLGLVHVYFYIIYFCTLFLYLCLSVFASVQQAAKLKKPILFLILPVSFFLFHFTHGAGVISGLAKLLFKRSPVQKIEKRNSD